MTKQEAEKQDQRYNKQTKPPKIKTKKPETPTGIWRGRRERLSIWGGEGKREEDKRDEKKITGKSRCSEMEEDAKREDKDREEIKEKMTT